MLRDEYCYLDSGENTGPAIFFGYVLWTVLVFANPAGHSEGLAMKNGAVIYLILGLAFLTVKIASVVRSGESTLAQEIAFGLKNGEIFAELLMWPLIAILFCFRDPFQISFKRQYYDNYWRRTKSERHGIHVATVNEWTDRKVGDMSRRADERMKVAVETVKPALRTATVGATAVVISTSSVHSESQSPAVQASAFADRQGDRQSAFTATQGNFVLLEQNRIAADGGSNTSLIGPGIKLPAWHGLNATIIVGPQFNWKDDGKMAVIKTIFNLSWQRGKFSLASANWVAYGPEQKRIVSSRHIQTLKIPGLPTWLQPNFEQLHVRGGVGFTELYTGLKISFGQWLGKNNFFGKASLTPYYNWAEGRERWDARLNLAF
jgi:hypothetical protein